MSHSKPLLVPWLRTKINSGKYPGVAWTNPEQTEFSIPWKHALRQDSSNADVLIFKAWAEVSGNGKAHGDMSVWKRNFRSALRAKGFEMIGDSKNDAANPHKVYRWPEEASSGACSSAGSQEQDDPGLFGDLVFPVQETAQMTSGGDIYMPEENIYNNAMTSTIDSDILQQCLQGLNIEPDIDGIAVLDLSPEPQQIEGMIGGHVLPEQPQHSVAYEDAVGGVGLPEQPAYPVDGAVGGAYDPQMVEQFRDSMTKTMDGDHLKTHFMVSVFYRGVKVSEQLVQNEAGLRLVYRPELTQPVFDPASGLTLVSLPCVGIHDQTQARLTRQILESLGEVDVGVSGPVVYGQRQGKTGAYWSLCRFDKSGTPQEVSKEPQSLYLFKDFLQGIFDFINGGKECPSCSLYICLGEKWPCPANRPLEKKLIVVEVVLKSLEMLKNMAVEGGASSLQSVELQISLEQMMELC